MNDPYHEDLSDEDLAALALFALDNPTRMKITEVEAEALRKFTKKILEERK